MLASCDCCGWPSWRHWYGCVQATDSTVLQGGCMPCLMSPVFLLQAFHVAVRLLLFRASVTKWTLFGFAFSALTELVCYRALAQIAGAMTGIAHNRIVNIRKCTSILGASLPCSHSRHYCSAPLWSQRRLGIWRRRLGPRRHHGLLFRCDLPGHLRPNHHCAVQQVLAGVLDGGSP
jgi:hypothetical protein